MNETESNDTFLHDLSYAVCSEFVPKFTRAKCIRCYDGDTVTLGTMIPGYGPSRFSCRLRGIDTPELRSRDPCEKELACIARDVVRGLLLHRLVSVEIVGIDKYGRLLVDLATEKKESISSYILEQGLAVEYKGGKKPDVNWSLKLSEWRSKQ